MNFPQLIEDILNQDLPLAVCFYSYFIHKLSIATFDPPMVCTFLYQPPPNNPPTPKKKKKKVWIKIKALELCPR